MLDKIEGLSSVREVVASRRGGTGGAERRRWSAGFAGNPYWFLGPRPLQEARLRSYILLEHRLGRRLDEILDDPYLRRSASLSLCWKVITEPATIAALGADDCRAIRQQLELLSAAVGRGLADAGSLAR